LTCTTLLSLGQTTITRDHICLIGSIYNEYSDHQYQLNGHAIQQQPNNDVQVYIYHNGSWSCLCCGYAICLLQLSFLLTCGYHTPSIRTSRRAGLITRIHTITVVVVNLSKRNLFLDNSKKCTTEQTLINTINKTSLVSVEYF